MKDLSINHAAVWVVIVLLHALGFLWYGALFNETWMALNGLDVAAIEANPPGISTWISNSIATIIPVYFLAWLFTQLNVNGAGQGTLMGLAIAFSFNFLSRMTSNLFAQRPYELSWVEGGYDLVALALAGLILGAWKKYR